ncbi:hypothetical protein BC937DRAFT_87437 [Endogone sp. FLAS-F59071]|nr:hypothetical protein BC937DRAFT_87437 [Endogone sp. FLAS-F59071]|eukprot:RUS12604.1 hypothetical protein BC937DRAFT_87437 [Endogone sp. FLAS-F59071]
MSRRIKLKFDENITDLMNSVEDITDAHSVEGERLRGEQDRVVAQYASRENRVVVTCDTDFLVENLQVGVLLLWGYLGRVPFNRLKRKVRKTVVITLFKNYRSTLERVWTGRETKMAILRGDPDNYKWEIRAPTAEEIIAFHNKWCFKSALPFSTNPTNE